MNIKKQIEKMVGIKLKMVEKIEGDLELDIYKQNKNIVIKRIAKSEEIEIITLGYYAIFNGIMTGYFKMEGTI